MKKLLITLIALTTFAPLCNADISSNLQGWWKFDEGTGTSAADSSGNANTGTLMNTPTWTTGKIGPYALAFNGSNQYVDVGTPASLGITGNITIAAWISMSSFPTGFNGCNSNCAVIIEKGYDGANESYTLRYTYDNPRATKTFQVASYNGTDFGTTYDMSVNTSEWHHLAGVYDGTNWMLYLDGVQVSQTAAGTGAISSTAKFFIGAADIAGSPARFFPGSIDDARVYNRALTASDITELYNYPSSVSLHSLFKVVYGRFFKVLVGKTFRIK